MRKQVRNCWTPVSNYEGESYISIFLALLVIGATAFALLCLAAVLGG